MKYYSVELGYIAYGVMTFHRTQRSTNLKIYSSTKTGEVHTKHVKLLTLQHRGLYVWRLIRQYVNLLVLIGKLSLILRCMFKQ